MKKNNLYALVSIILVLGFIAGYLTQIYNLWFMVTAIFVIGVLAIFIVGMKKTKSEVRVESSSTPWVITTLLFAVLTIGSLMVDIDLSKTDTLAGSADKAADDVVAATADDDDTVKPEAVKADVSVDDDYVLGDADAPVTMIEFSDYQCPYCERHFSQTTPEIKKNYVDTGKVKLIFRDFPLSFHPNAFPAATAANCAGEQGEYWNMHDALFESQADWTELADPNTEYKKLASNLGLNTSEFATCLESGDQEAEIEKDFKDGQVAGVKGTPAFFINGEFISGAQPYANFSAVIDKYLAN
ncbi:MAG: DsbA family protein [bacterium]